MDESGGRAELQVDMGEVEVGTNVQGSDEFSLRLLGGFELARRGESLEVPDATRKVVAYLGLRDRPSSRALIAAELWPDKAEPRASANLRSAVWRLRGSDLSSLLLVRGGDLSLRNVAIDVRQLRDLPAPRDPSLAGDLASINGHATTASEGDPPAAPAPTPLRRRPDGRDSDAPVDDLLFEPLLPGWNDRWVVIERERLCQRQLHRLDEIIAALLEHRQPALAIDLALRLVGLDPLRERSQVALIRSYAAEGSYGHARRQYDQYRELVERVTGQPCRLSYDDAAREGGRSVSA